MSSTAINYELAFKLILLGMIHEEYVLLAIRIYISIGDILIIGCFSRILSCTGIIAQLLHDDHSFV